MPEWWLVALCVAVDSYARAPISWEMAQAIGYELTSRMATETREHGRQ